MTGHQIRQQFLDFFAARGHRIVRSSSLLPAKDPTLLFTNAGMNQFKDVFLGMEKRDYRRACTSQKCVRAGGKHNDLENVGYTRRHHTFFEMLGNFSFGDYFKAEAIEFAWDLITRDFGIPKERLYITVFREDDEAEELWQKVAGVPRERIFRQDEKDNFWQMGETGPCGPCSELHYDLGPGTAEIPVENDEFPSESGRFVEIWNLVFMQFDRDTNGVLTPLPRPSIDTGMGLERVAAVMQGKLSNYDTDLLRPIIERAAGMFPAARGDDATVDSALRIVADHSRAAEFLIHDGVVPSNDGRGYVLRKIMRRAMRHARRLGVQDPFLYQLTGFVAELMRPAYPELMESLERVARIVKDEEHRYATTFQVAERMFHDEAKGAAAGGSARGGGVQALRHLRTAAGRAGGDGAGVRAGDRPRRVSTPKWTSSGSARGPVGRAARGRRSLPSTRNCSRGRARDSWATRSWKRSRAWRAWWPARRRSRASRRASAPNWCWTRRRSTRKPAARWATRARCTAWRPATSWRRSRIPTRPCPA